MTLTDNSSALAETQERVSQLQTVVVAGEHDRRVLQERLDITRSDTSSSSSSSSSNLAFTHDTGALTRKLANGGDTVTTAVSFSSVQPVLFAAGVICLVVSVPGVLW